MCSHRAPLSGPRRHKQGGGETRTAPLGCRERAPLADPGDDRPRAPARSDGSCPKRQAADSSASCTQRRRFRHGSGFWLQCLVQERHRCRRMASLPCGVVVVVSSFPRFPSGPWNVGVDTATGRCACSDWGCSEPRLHLLCSDRENRRVGGARTHGRTRRPRVAVSRGGFDFHRGGAHDSRPQSERESSNSRPRPRERRRRARSGGGRGGERGSQRDRAGPGRRRAGEHRTWAWPACYYRISPCHRRLATSASQSRPAALKLGDE